MRIKKGLDLPIKGVPEQFLEDVLDSKHVAVVGQDYIGMKPTMLVKEGDTVKAGQPVFSCKKVEGVLYTAPASGKVVKIQRGERRVFQNLVIEKDQSNEFHSYDSYISKNPEDYTTEELTKLLIDSGLWPSFRTRPFSKAPEVGSTPHSIFVTCIDTNPLAADPAVVIKGYSEYFQLGIKLLKKLTEGKVFVCREKLSDIEVRSDEQIQLEEFEGVHPAGNVGTHIHFLDPVSANKTVWHIGYQDVISIGAVASTGKIWTDRVIAISGTGAKKPRLVKVKLGANLHEALSGELHEGSFRMISGSVLAGRTASEEYPYLGKFHTQVTIIPEGGARELLGWHSPGLDKFSVKSIYLSKLIPNKLFNFNTTTNGSPRAMVPVGNFEQVMPLDILPTQLLRALITNDTESAQALGCLELDEEDLALCTYVCPGKTDYGPILRENLTLIEKEG